MKERIKVLRKSIPEYGKTQDSFAKYLGISKQNLASYETGRRVPSEGVVQLICEKCNVNREWLEKGTGRIFKETSRDISFYLGKIEKGNDDFIKDLIEVYMELDPDSKKALRMISEKMAEKRKEREAD